MTTTSADVARETAIARLSGHAAIVFERAHEDYSELVIAIYEQAYRDALTYAWDLRDASRAIREAMTYDPIQGWHLSGVSPEVIEAFDAALADFDK